MSTWRYIRPCWNLPKLCLISTNNVFEQSGMCCKKLKRNGFPVQTPPANNRRITQRYFSLQSHEDQYIQKADSTIYALSSGHGKCGVAVIRVSGRESKNALLLLTKLGHLPRPRKALLKTLYRPSTTEPLDKSLVLWFPGPRSFTGEDCCELHIHGGSAVITSVLEALEKIPGLRHAEAGEYTKRAFQNGKLDLTEVEGLADLIHAETEAQRKQALRQMEGGLSKLYTNWRKRLLKCTANVEAYIDFSEDQNIEDDVMDNVLNDVTSIQAEVEKHLTDNRQGERLRNGVHVVILGEPNVGKSSLLNAICQRPAAIVSPIAGTTRDVVETPLNIGGYPVLLSDTAGLRQTEDVIEKEGVKRAVNRAQLSDLKVMVVEADHFYNQVKSNRNFRMQDFIRSHFENLGLMDNNSWSRPGLEKGEANIDTFNTSVINPKELVIVLNKSDLMKSSAVDLKHLEFDGLKLCLVSCTTQDGFDDFLEALAQKVKDMCGNPLAGNPSLTQARHRAHLTNCLQALKTFLDMNEMDIVLAAEELRKALRNIGKITGKITSEDILDVVFRDFCIGK
ncbi:tRNA modification GTPase GTPBP3, mitochondrial-like [Lineus longissimus]|uniref:tRNA modification GTPase GTPBP3, mitochondrial-like n=1 Tax=Lineus longissimus TaxID=88925 RepID=UPI00315D3986